MKKIGLFSLLGVVLLLSAILFSEKDVLANSSALGADYELRTVTCFRTITKDSSKEPLISVYDCDDCKQYGILSAEENSSCLAKFSKRETEIN